MSKEIRARVLLVRVPKRHIGLLGKHMGFVKYIDLVFALYGCIGDCIPYGPNIIYTSVGGCVYLYKVWEGALIYGHTVFTNSARLSLLWLKTVYGLCKYSGYGGLSSPPWTSKKISVRKLPQPYGVFENSDWYFLPYHLRKGLWPILSGKGDIHDLNSIILIHTSGEKFPLSQTFHINKKTAGLL